MTIWTYTLISVFLVSLLSLVGVVTLAIRSHKLEKVIHILVSFAVGSLFGGAFLHIIPETYERFGVTSEISLYILLGILLFFGLEKFVRWRHCHVPTSERHVHPLVPLNLFGDAAHNFLDGMIIAAGYLAGIPMGIATTIAVAFHELPQEIGAFGILVHGGLPVRKALLFNFLIALTSILGALTALIIGPQIDGFIRVLLPMTAGGFIYIAGSDLIPELHHDQSTPKAFVQFLFIVLGILVMALLRMAIK